MPVTGLIGIFKHVLSCLDCRSFKALISLHFRRMQACLFAGSPKFYHVQAISVCRTSALHATITGAALKRRRIRESLAKTKLLCTVISSSCNVSLSYSKVYTEKQDDIKSCVIMIVLLRL